MISPKDIQDPAATDQLFCWEQVLRIRPSFRISYPYVPPQFSAGVLALYALFSAIEESHSRASDSDVSRTKLIWWREQLLGPGHSATDHPIIRRLRQTEVLGNSGRSHLSKMMEIELDRLDMRVPRDEHELKSLCVALGYHPMRLEFSQQAEPEPGAGLEGACAVNGLVQLMRESSRASVEPYWWVPSSLLTHHGLRRVDLQSDAESEVSGHLMTEICGIGLAWLPVESPKSRDGKFDKDVREVEGHEKRIRLHWFIQSELNARLLKRLRRRHLNQHAEQFAKIGLRDSWIVWRFARDHLANSILA